MPSSLSIAPPERRWVSRGAQADTPDAVAALQTALGLPATLCRLLLRRGYGEPDSAKVFLKPRLEQLHDPFGLAGMQPAVNRLNQAIERGETILVHGDYDVDGVCSAALMTRILRRLGAQAEAFVPHRMDDGYDLSQSGVRAAAEIGASLIVTGDCGIVAHDAIAAAKASGIDVIVTDHHTPGEVLPPAVAVINPNRPDCGYENKALAGAGVAFKLCEAVWTARGHDPQELWYYLDLVALATVADLAQLTGENRVMTRFGLKLMTQTRNPGLKALVRSAGLGECAELTAGQVSHVLAPRVNAVGRMSAAEKGVRLFLEEDEQVAQQLAGVLEEENRTRQEVDRRTLAEALEQLERDYDPARDYAVVIGGEGWHPGVIGIVASRVVERIHRPTVLFALEGSDRARGSARSIPGFHLYDALKACSGFLDRFGGHKAAAGMDIRPDRIDAFRAALNAEAHERLTEEQLIPEIAYDLEISLSDATMDLVKLMRHCGPFGIGNPTPVLVTRNANIASQRPVGEGHVKLALVQDGARLSAIGFNLAARVAEVDCSNGVDVVYRLEENHWRGRVELQAKLIDIRPAE